VRVRVRDTDSPALVGVYSRGMTDNLPATRSDNFGPTNLPLSQTPTEALAFVLGWASAQPVRAEAFGGYCAVVEELQRRREVHQTRDDVVRGGVHGDQLSALMSLLPPALARSIGMLYQVQRGQRWASTGQYRQGSGNSD
jgi:hypothetical protein